MDQETLHGQAGAYRIYESIASGGFGSVFIGRDISTNVPVAVKRLHAHLKDEPGFVERFEQEASTVRGLAHPNIVRLLDQGRDASGVPFIVMEWVEGLTIGDWLKRRGTYTPTDAAEVGCQVLEGLDAAWARRVVHRDIKPANLMVTPSGRVKIMDFGVAKDVELATLAGSSGIIGTPAYMAPEQLRGKPLDCRADLYALGVTLQLMLTGRPPFEGPSFADYFRQHLEEEPPPVVAQGVDTGLAAVVRRALAKAPEDRYGSPGEMLTALRPYANERTLPKAEPHVSETVRAPLASKRRVTPWAIAAPLIGVAVVAVGVALLVAQPRAGAQNQVAASVGTSSAVVTTPQSDGTFFSNPLTTDAQAAVLRKTASPSAYLIGRAPDNTYAIQKLLGDNSPPGIAALPLVATDGVMGVDVSIAQPAATGVVLLGCRDQAGTRGRYQMSLMPGSGRVMLSQLTSGAERPLEDAVDASAFLHTDGAPDRLELVCAASTLTARVNGHEVATAQNGDYSDGGWLIGAGAAGAPFEAHFTNLVVRRPP